MPHYAFFVNNNDIRATDNISEQSALVESGYQKIDFETDAVDSVVAIKLLQKHLSLNTEAIQKFTGDITFTSIIDSLIR